MTEKKSNKKIIIAAIILVVLLAAALVIWKVASPKASAGAKSITIEVVDDNAASTIYEVHTDAEYLSQAFEDADGLTVEGTTSDYGLYIDTINGVTADYNKDGAYWAIYVNGEYGQYGADQQPVTDGDAYQLVYEVYSAG